MKDSSITTLFLDVGGVLGTNGWDHNIRKQVTESFGLDYPVIESRHASLFETYELGKISLDEYLEWVIFFQKRPFSKEEFKAKMYAQSVPDEQMLDFFRKIKESNHLKIVIVSNEGRGLAEYRVDGFGLKQLSDTLIFSSFVTARKPDLEIYKLALDLSQAKPSEVLYIDDRSLYVEIARSLGIEGIAHKDLQKTAAIFESYGIYPKEEISLRITN